jgi:hypothetical protein
MAMGLSEGFLRRMQPYIVGDVRHGDEVAAGMQPFRLHPRRALSSPMPGTKTEIQRILPSGSDVYLLGCTAPPGRS